MNCFCAEIVPPPLPPSPNQALEKQTKQKEADDELELLAAMIEGATRSPFLMPPSHAAASALPSRLSRRTPSPSSPAITDSPLSGVPDNGQAFEPAKGASKDTKAKKQPGVSRLVGVFYCLTPPPQRFRLLRCPSQ
jgi:hypothetical protein